ncbi:tRNA dihydrouridine synthase, partial [Spiromyces aspiralis]
MVRYSKQPFRELVRSYGVDIACTPMILADVFKESEYGRGDFTTSPDDTPVVVQFAASNSKDFADAAELVAPFADGIDLNCGCPQRWAIQEKIGSYLMDEPELVRDMVRAVKGRGIATPCSIKIRKHPDIRTRTFCNKLQDIQANCERKLNWAIRHTIEFVRRAEATGVDWITIHGRTRKQKSTLPVDVEAIRLVKETATVPVVANGGVFSLKEAEELRERTGVDGI